MADNRLPTEVELAFEVMPCNAMRIENESPNSPHACAYFRDWGTYHSFDYTEDGPPQTPGIDHDVVYLGRRRLVPEILSGCRKAPIISVGINPNLPGWWGSRRGSLNPWFDDYKQFAHYFRYRAISKLELSRDDYERYGGGRHDQPIVDNNGTHGDFELSVPEDANGQRSISTQMQPQGMYEAYDELLQSLANRMNWPGHELSVGEDLSYGNMVACPSARWTTRATRDSRLPVMTRGQRRGIVSECFRERKYFLRQLFQSLPPIILIFSQSTANAFIGEMQDRFIEGNPAPGDRLDELIDRTIRMKYGDLRDDSELTARVIFAPHITGNPQDFGPARAKVVDQMVEEAEAGRVGYNSATKHLERPRGACVFCPMFEIGQCDYSDELRPLTDVPVLTADSPASLHQREKSMQIELMDAAPTAVRSVDEQWGDTDDPDDKSPNSNGDG